MIHVWQLTIGNRALAGMSHFAFPGQAKNAVEYGATRQTRAASWTAPAERERRRRFRAHEAGGEFKSVSGGRKRCRAALATAVQDAAGDNVKRRGWRADPACE